MEIGIFFTCTMRQAIAWSIPVVPKFLATTKCAGMATYPDPQMGQDCLVAVVQQYSVKEIPCKLIRSWKQKTACVKRTP